MELPRIIGSCPAQVRIHLSTTSVHHDAMNAMTFETTGIEFFPFHFLLVLHSQKIAMLPDILLQVSLPLVETQRIGKTLGRHTTFATTPFHRHDVIPVNKTDFPMYKTIIHPLIRQFPPPNHEASALRLLYALYPDWASRPWSVKIKAITEGIINTVCFQLFTSLVLQVDQQNISSS